MPSTALYASTLTIAIVQNMIPREAVGAHVHLLNGDHSFHCTLVRCALVGVVFSEAELAEESWKRKNREVRNEGNGSL